MECSDYESEPDIKLIEGIQCPSQTIRWFFPSSGPPSGGTLVAIRGTDLGVTIDDFDPPNGITVGGVTCAPQSTGYESGRTVVCKTATNLTEGAQDVIVTLRRTSGLTSVTAPRRFNVVVPELRSVEPDFGPIAGGSRLRISGTGLNIGSSVRVTLDGAAGPECVAM